MSLIIDKGGTLKWDLVATTAIYGFLVVYMKYQRILDRWRYYE